tara:strand:+ start:619 stop:1209 length:591 start_codon:yes stop_codon:yes gene_type:complete
MKKLIKKLLREGLLDEAAITSLAGIGFFANESESVLGLYKSEDMKKGLENYDADEINEAVIGAVELRYNESLQTYEINSIYADKGYGPLLYLIAMTKSPEGLIPSRTSQVSKSAKSVWEQFYSGKGQGSVTFEPIKAGRHQEDYMNQKYFIKNPIDLNKAESVTKDILKNDKYGEKLSMLEEAIDGRLRQEMRDIY